MTGPWFIWPLYICGLAAFWIITPHFARLMESYWTARGIPARAAGIVPVFRSVIVLLSIFWLSALIATLAH